MPQNIIWRDFSGGWVPSDNDVNGRKNGFLQMNNVELDENGALVLAGGAISLYPSIPSPANTMYSRFMGSTRYDYANTNSGSIYRNGVFLNSGGSTIRAAFGTAFDYVLYCSGSVRKKDNGGTQVNLGVNPATAAPGIVISSANSPYANIGSLTVNFAYGPNNGTPSMPGGAYQQITTDGNGEAVIQTYFATPTPINTNNLQGVGGASNIGYATDNDFITLAGYLLDPFGKSLQVDILLVPGNATADLVTDYYTYVVEDLATEASFNTDGSFSVRMKRGDFVRNGAGQQGWSTVYGYRITFKGQPAEKINLLGNALNDPMIRIIGGDKSQNGQYQYMQVNINNTGSYIAKSPIGLISNPVDIDMGQAIITPINPTSYDAQCNEAWVFRRGGELSNWYRVLVFAGTYTARYDTMSDEAALKLNIQYNEKFTTVSSAANGIPDHILAIVGPIEGRWFYFTQSFMYPSEINNPDLVDPTIAIKLTGSNTEKFMWAYKIGERTVIVGTTVDIYLLTGTFITQPDFTVDVYYDSVGCEYPPITKDGYENSNGVAYLAKDGWRIVAPNGQTQNLVTPNTDRLYDNQTCYGYAPANLNFQPGIVNFPVVLTKERLWCFITGNDRAEVYDFNRKYWRVITYPGSFGGITAATSTQDGKVIAYFNSGILREIDYSGSKSLDGSTQQSILIKSLVFDNNTPVQRKDSEVFKVHAYTGGNIVAISIINDAGVSVAAGNLISNNPSGTEFNFDLSVTQAAITKTYQIVMSGVVSDFRLIDAQIWFETRPVPVSFRRIQSLNYGNVARKRLYSIPFVIDTTGNSVIFTPIVDGIAQTNMPVICNYKATFNYKSVMLGNETDIIGRDFEYTIYATAGTFEFFDLPQPRLVEVLPDPIKSYIIPNSNFGTTSRKRLRVLRIVIDTLGTQVKYTPVINGVDQASTTYVTTRKQTIFHYFTSDQIGVDWGGRLESVNTNNTFELYEVLAPQDGDIEIFPDTVEFYIIPPNNYGTDNKKYLRSISMVIDTHNKPVLFTPIVDGVELTPTSTFITPVTGKTTVTHYFTNDNIGVDFGGRLENIATPKEPFELWQVLPPGDGDITPITASALYHRVMETNFGSPNKKRVRVWPFIINTHGFNVNFTAIVDCQPIPITATFNTNCKETIWYFFNSDVFGVDYGGIFQSPSGNIFDLWEVMTPDIVQVLPIARRFDQVGPQELFRYGKIKQMELRVLPFNTGDVSNIPVVIYFNDNTTYETTFVVDNNKEASYFLGTPKGTAGNIVRIELGPTAFNFHRFYMRLQAARSGFNTELEWVELETGTHQRN